MDNSFCLNFEILIQFYLQQQQQIEEIEEDDKIFSQIIAREKNEVK